MDFFSRIVSAVGSLPEWVCVAVCPAVFAVAVPVLFAIGKKGAYPYLAAGIGGAGLFFVSCRGDISCALAWAGLFGTECALLRLLFLIPRGKRAKKRDKSKEDRIYEKFREELSDPFGKPPVAKGKLPPKICCFEESPSAVRNAEESGLRLSYVTQLLEKLRAAKLSAADRLETDVLFRSLDLYRNKKLGDEEMHSLNDCLAVVLKLTAKYQL